jgi:TolB-like protein/DNA-binding winged helix-turn-helix (wHTH) protein
MLNFGQNGVPVPGQANSSSRILRFSTFEVNLDTGELRQRGQKVKLQEQPFQVLTALLERPGEVVSREDLRRRLWPADTFVDFDHSLNAAIKRLREALGDAADAPIFIETLARRGYRFIAPIDGSSELSKPANSMPEKAKSTAVTQPSTESTAVRQNWLPLHRWQLALTTVAVLVAAAVLFASDVGGLRSRFLHPSTPAVAQPQIRSLAVLPLTNMSGDHPEQEYFGDAMTEELIGELSRIGAVKVISRTSVMQYKGEKKKPLSQIGRELNVDAVLEGSVLCVGNQVRIAAHMIYAPTDQTLMTETYESDLGDVLKLQREVAESIAQKVRLKLTPEQEARFHDAPKVDPEAYQAYLKATSLDWGLYQENKQAQSYLEKAIQKDPTFVLAYSALAGTYVVMAETRRRSPRDVYPPAKQAAHKALELDEKSCVVHKLLANIAWSGDWDWQTAEKEYLHTLELCPNDESAHSAYSFYAAVTGRNDLALAEMAKTRELDPIKAEPLQGESVINYHSRNYKALIDVSRSFTASHPNYWAAYFWLGVGYEGSGQTLEAVPEYKKAVEMSQGDSDATAALAHAYAATGRKAEAQKILHEWLRQSENSYVSPYMIATVYAGLGEKDKAFEYLEKAYQERSSDLPYFLKADLRVDSLRSDPRFQSDAPHEFFELTCTSHALGEV